MTALALRAAAGDDVPMHSDAHIHFVDLAARDPGFHGRFLAAASLACAASHDEGEFHETESLAALSPPGTVPLSFGIHPQWAVWKNADLLASLAASGRIDAIGEAGFDFFGDLPERVRNPANEATQTAVFEYQLGIAERHGLPMILHIRRGMDKVFGYSRRLARLPAIVLHSYSGTAREAGDLLGRGVRAYFSFGAAILNGHKRAIEACALVPEGSLLSETDAPWQPPRGREYCPFEAIADIVRGMAALRGVRAEGLEASLESNFRAVFPARPLASATPRQP